MPILTYHRVHRYATEPVKSIPDLTIEPASFDAQMAAISRAGYHAITQRQLYGALFRHARLPARPVLLTVDDGYADDAERILPALRRRRLVATFYVITRRLGQPGFLTAAQVRQLERAGMDVGAHTRTHVTLPALAPPALRSEVSGSQSDLQRVLGHPVPWFAYPFGAYDAAVVRAVRGAGFVLAVTTRGGTLQSGDRALTLPRVHVGRSTTVAVILGCLRAPAACAGGA
ncbi:MAG: hypothetical protein QOK31_2001 [Solirubrobacteraceae bacterium]|nr:hypothetical protein [Solirubrobacteraceae bacterium]